MCFYKDIFKNVFEDNSQMPCEIKWQTSDFKDPDQINAVKNLNGFFFEKSRKRCTVLEARTGPRVGPTRVSYLLFASFFLKNQQIYALINSYYFV